MKNHFILNIFLIALALFLITGFVVGYNPTGTVNPAVMGHTANEINVTLGSTSYSLNSLINLLYQPTDVTSEEVLNDLGWINDGVYHRISKLIVLPAPLQGKRWKITIRTYNQVNTYNTFYYRKTNWESGATPTETILSNYVQIGNNPGWYETNFYETSAVKFYLEFRNFYQTNTYGYFAKYKTPSVRYELIDA
ncbi:MAG: hypothetical protein KKD48_04290 [Nanoarchaeota archaeon]|nr:hypothetical protein [Nanoarchaeota archaeon]